MTSSHQKTQILVIIYYTSTRLWKQIYFLALGKQRQKMGQSILNAPMCCN